MTQETNPAVKSRYRQVNVVCGYRKKPPFDKYLQGFKGRKREPVFTDKAEKAQVFKSTNHASRVARFMEALEPLRKEGVEFRAHIISLEEK